MKKYVATAIILALPINHVLAEESDDKEMGWSGEAAFGYTENSGNTDSTLLDFRSKATHDTDDHWRNIFRLEAGNETTDGVRTKEDYFGSAKADYKFGESSYWFGLLEYTNDNFSGFDYEAAISFGYGQDILKNDVHKLSADAGLGYRRSELDDSGGVIEEAFLRLAAIYNWKISETMTFDEDFSIEVGEEKTITKSYTRLRLKVNGNLFAFVAYDIEHTSDVPPGTKNSDRTTLLGLDYTF